MKKQLSQQALRVFEITILVAIIQTAIFSVVLATNINEESISSNKNVNLTLKLRNYATSPAGTTFPIIWKDSNVNFRGNVEVIP
ncbi:MAG: hypothetical protein WBA23_23895, partial [Tunicatimonas sp.]|uniref:hypothetical protein n=1 Tax=Tunicatimonas sp. TaxID=1940096 RepID=UPI003C7064C3